MREDKVVGSVGCERRSLDCGGWLAFWTFWDFGGRIVQHRIG